MPSSKTSRGFTLIELLVVISIISLLAAIILASLNSARSQARDARRKEDLHQIAIALNVYFAANNALPEGTGWCTYISNATNGWGPDFQSKISPAYISTVPLDPTKANQVGDYFYSSDDAGSGKFTLCAVLENPTGLNYNSTYGACAGWSNSYNYCISQT